MIKEQFIDTEGYKLLAKTLSREGQQQLRVWETKTSNQNPLELLERLVINTKENFSVILNPSSRGEIIQLLASLKEVGIPLAEAWTEEYYQRVLVAHFLQMNGILTPKMRGKVLNIFFDYQQPQAHLGEWPDRLLRALNASEDLSENEGLLRDLLTREFHQPQNIISALLFGFVLSRETSKTIQNVVFCQLQKEILEMLRSYYQTHPELAISAIEAVFLIGQESLFDFEGAANPEQRWQELWLVAQSLAHLTHQAFSHHSQQDISKYNPLDN